MKKAAMWRGFGGPLLLLPMAYLILTPTIYFNQAKMLCLPDYPAVDVDVDVDVDVTSAAANSSKQFLELKGGRNEGIYVSGIDYYRRGLDDFFERYVDRL